MVWALRFARMAAGRRGGGFAGRSAGSGVVERAIVRGMVREGTLTTVRDSRTAAGRRGLSRNPGSRCGSFSRRGRSQWSVGQMCGSLRRRTAACCQPPSVPSAPWAPSVPAAPLVPAAPSPVPPVSCGAREKRQPRSGAQPKAVPGGRAAGRPVSQEAQAGAPDGNAGRARLGPGGGKERIRWGERDEG